MESNNPTTRINQTFANWCLSSLFLSCLSIGCTHLSAISRLWQFLYISYMLHLAHPLQCKRCQRWSVRYQWISRVGAPQQLESISQYCNILQHIATYCNTSTIFYTHWQKIAKSGSTQRWWKHKTLHSAVWRQSCPEMFLLRCLVWPCRTSWVSCQQQHAEQILCTCDTANPHRRQCLHWNFLIECQMRQDNTTCMNTCSGQTQSTCNTCKLLSAWKHDGKPSINQITRGHSPAFLQARSHVQFWQSTVLFLGTLGSGMLWHNLPEDQLHTTHWMQLLEFASAEHLGEINGSKTASLVISGNHPQLSREKKRSIAYQ